VAAGEECVFMYHFRETLTATGGVLLGRTGQAICRPRDCRSSYCPAWRAKGQGYGRRGWGGSSSEVHSGSVTVQTVQTMSPAGALAAQLGPLWSVCFPHLVTTFLFAPITAARASQFLELVED
jgi:hypothetical protein